jgi:hypothetical protein
MSYFKNMQACSTFLMWFADADKYKTKLCTLQAHPLFILYQRLALGSVMQPAGHGGANSCIPRVARALFSHSETSINGQAPSLKTQLFSPEYIKTHAISNKDHVYL